MEASLRRLRTINVIGADDRKAFLGLLSGIDVTGYRSQDKRSLMVEIHRECNRI